MQIYTPMPPLDAGERRQKEFGKPVEIGSDVWIGGGAIILPGVRIGSRAVIGAGRLKAGARVPWNIGLFTRVSRSMAIDSAARTSGF